MTATIWRPIATAPKRNNGYGAGPVIRLKGFDSRHPRREAKGFWLHGENIWTESIDEPDPDGIALSSYPGDLPAYGPTHWRPLRERKRKSA